MLEIGNNVKITAGVTILTHDFSWCVTSGLEDIFSVEWVRLKSAIMYLLE